MLKKIGTAAMLAIGASLATVTIVYLVVVSTMPDDSTIEELLAIYSTSLLIYFVGFTISEFKK